ncbi:meiotic nuclear division protein 1 [Nannochloropsis gaditana]|uniref:Meiotic nuclear division protein 1 n=2 Tax=Nannochloropsis gaditana TaxID=72520 RepID=W7TRE1_9STRA|nr:meiotic nuclear division protein 1 [Nannochloropsis gaditana]
MPKRKGMSLEEKRQTILKIYHSTGAVYSLKEMEGLASKQGVVSQSVKDVNQGLVDDGLVEMEKVGASNVFFAFPGKAIASKRTATVNLESEVARLKAHVSTLEEKAAALSAGRQDSEKRRQNMEDYETALALKTKQLEEVQRFKDNDPVKIERLEAQAALCKQGVNRWTDNIFSIKSYLVKKRGMYSKDVDKFLGLTDSFDYVE